jgi:hypothetical protein
MSIAVRSSKILLAAVLAAWSLGCEEQPKPEPTKPKTEPTASAAPAPTPSQTASAAPLEPRDDCPDGSAGPGTFEKPCLAEGTARVMKAEWTGKIDDKGPWFRVTNTSKLTILYGLIDVYFYDKKGKQLEVPGDKPRPMQPCGGNIFAGVMKPGEKATMAFSCVTKKDVPEGTESIEAEIQMAGFADDSGKKNEFYWKNQDLAPDQRPKGGIKPKHGKKSKK